MSGSEGSSSCSAGGRTPAFRGFGCRRRVARLGAKCCWRRFWRSAGWALIGFPAGFAPGRIYQALQAGDAGYEPKSVYDVLPGLGYWRYFDAPTTIDLSRAALTSSPVSVQVPAGQFAMVGNPFASSAAIDLPDHGDLVYIYDPQSGYQLADHLGAGQGAFVYSFRGGILTLTAQ